MAPVARVLRTGAVALAALGIASGDMHHTTDVRLGPRVSRVKVRMFWIRHGQSCANVMDRCKVKTSQAEEYMPKVEAALKRFGEEYKETPLTGKLMEADSTEPDCTVELVTYKLTAGERSDNGAIIRVHDLMRDPTLTVCARHQSTQAGKTFLQWLRDSGIRVDFLGSSFLMRAFQTASAMFIEQDVALRSAVLDDGVFVTPLPYLTERAPAGITSVQRDNEPRRIEEQIEILSSASKEKGAQGSDFRPERVNQHYAKTWPSLQHFEKFKAFLAAHVVPSLEKVRRDLYWAKAPEDVLKYALESQLKPEMDPAHHGHKVRVAWPGGAYETGMGFTKAEYEEVEAPEVTIAFVGHNQMMLEYCLGGDMSKKPNNNAVLEKLFIVEATPGVEAEDTQYAHIVLRELAENCAKVMDSPSGTTSLASLVHADVANCQDPYDVSEWIGLAKPEDSIFGSWAPGSHTQCMKLADGGAASYPISEEFSPRPTASIGG